MSLIDTRIPKSIFKKSGDSIRSCMSVLSESECCIDILNTLKLNTLIGISSSQVSVKVALDINVVHLTCHIHLMNDY